MPDSNPLDEIKAKAWNESILPRLEAIRSGFNESFWMDGVAPYLRTRFNKFLDYRFSGSSTLTHEQEKFMDGQMAMLREILEFPHVIKAHIDTIDKAKKTAEQREQTIGPAGY